MIEKIEVIDGGLFSRTSLRYTITVPEKGLKVIRTDYGFNWLMDSLEKEFPFIPLPPLLNFYDPSYSKETLNNIQTYYQQFLNELMDSQSLRGSLALEVFLNEDTKKGFEKRKKELKKFFSNYIRIGKNLSKKYYDGMSSKNPIALYPNDINYVEIKISSILKKFYISIDGKFNKYSEIFG